MVIDHPGLPRAKGRARFGQGRVFTPKRTADAEKSLKSAAREAMQGEPPYRCAIWLSIVFVFEVPKSWSVKAQEAALFHVFKPDIDNLVKLVKDSLNKIVWSDDSIVAVWGPTYKVYGPAAATRIHIRPATILDIYG